MRIETTSSGSFQNTTNWLSQSMNKSPETALNNIGNEGVAKLKNATPRGETGQTASGWDFRVKRLSTGAEVAFINTAHPESAVNVAKLIQFGHGTGTGGYVPPRDYINPALKDTFNSAGDRIAKEMF